MGIKNLSYLFKNKLNIKNEEILLKDLQYKKIGIDTSLFLYRFYYNQNNIIESFLKQIICFKKNGLEPIYVLDGGWTDEKKDIIDYRKKKKEEIKLKLKNTNNDLERRRLEKKLVYFKKDDINQLKKLFEVLGITYLIAEFEADKVLVKIAKEKYIDAVLSEDTDFIASCCPVVLKNFSLRFEKVNVIYPLKIVNELNLNPDDFLKICILSGSDYTQKIKGRKIIDIYEDVIENKGNLSPFSIYNENMEKYKRAFELLKDDCYFEVFNSKFSYYLTKNFFYQNNLIKYFNQTQHFFL